ncbi:MAG: DMT family transporter [Chloroflexota bacterium]
MTHQTRYSLYVLTASLLASIGTILSEVALRFFLVTPFHIAFLSNIVGGIILLAPILRQDKNPWHAWPRKDWLRLIVVAFAIYVAGFLMVFTAVDQIGSGKVTLLSRLETIFIVILAVFFLGEIWSGRHWMATILALVGTVLINFDPTAWQLDFNFGELLTLIGALIFAAGIVLLKPVLDKRGGQLVTGTALLVAAVFLAFLFPFLATPIEWHGMIIILLILMGIFRGTSWSLYNSAMPHIGASRCAILFLSVAFFTVLLQVIVDFIHPQLGLQVPSNLFMAVLGGVIIATSIVIIQRNQGT